MKPRTWSGRGVTRARAIVAATLPAPCGRCGKPVEHTDVWIVGHKKSRAAYPELTWEPSNWQPEHDACSRRTAQAAVQEKAARDALRAAGIDPAFPIGGDAGQPPLFPFSPSEGQVAPPPAHARPARPTPARIKPLEVRDDLVWDVERLAAFPWLRPLLDVPDDAAPPLAMTPPHPEAVDSYGADVIEWIESTQKITLRWWQRLAIVRQFEHRADGSLCWYEVLESAPRRSGKSVRIRGVALWRLSHAALIGETQTVIHCGNDLPICREIQRGAWRWAEATWGRDAVTKANGKEAVEAGDGSRWLVRSQDGVYGYDAGLAVVDEAWDVKPDTITEGLEPAMLERLWAQLHITSTAHRRATSLMRSKITAALTADDGETLLLLWGALPQDDPGDPATWRKASPHWSEDRRRMIANKYDKALLGEADPAADDPDPMSGFIAQYLNVWALGGVTITKGDPVTDAESWAELEADVPDGRPSAAAIESWFDAGASVALAWPMDDGAALVRVVEVPDLAAAAYVVRTSGFKGTTLVGKSLMTDPALARLRREAGQGTAVNAVLDLGRLLAADQLVHADSPTLTAQVLDVRTTPAAGGAVRLLSTGRTDAIKAAAWAAARGRRARPRVTGIVVAG